MNCINNFAKKYAHTTKTRGRLLTIIIAASTVLIFTIGMIVLFMMAPWIVQDSLYFGSYDGMFLDLADDKIPELAGHRNVLDIGVVTYVGNLQNEHKNPVMQMNEEIADNLLYKLEQGTYPVKVNDIALSKGIIDGFEEKLEIGDTLKLEIKHKDDSVSINEFKLCGIVQEIKTGEKTNMSVSLVSDKYLLNFSSELMGTYTFVDLNGPFNNKNKLYSLGTELGITKDKIYIPGLSFMISDISLPGTSIALIVLLIAIISISSICSHSTIERIKTIGLLKAIGMTKKQLQKLFISEAFSFIKKGISYGLILGIALICLLGVFGGGINETLASATPLRYLGIPVVRNIAIAILFGTIIIEIFAVYISVLIPLRKTRKLLIIECINYEESYKTKKNKKQTNFIKNPSIRLAFIKLMSNKRKTFLIIGSLAFSVIAFISFSSLMNSIEIDRLLSTLIDGEIQLQSLASYEISQEEKEILSSLEGVEKVYTSKLFVAEINVDDIKINPSFENIVNQFEQAKVSTDTVFKTNIIGYDENMQELKNLNIIGNEAVIFDFYGIGNYKEGDEITLSLNGRQITVSIIGFTNNEPRNIFYESYSPVVIVDSTLLEEVFDVENYFSIALDVSEERYDDAKAYIKNNFKNDNLMVTYLDDEIKSQDKTTNIMTILGYSLVTVIALISFMVLINNIYSSIISRKKEFGILRSVGMTKKQFNKLILWEGNIYILFIALIGTPLGIILAKITVDEFGSEYSHIHWDFAEYSLLILVLYYIAILFIVLLNMSKMDKQSVAELIRNE